MYILTESKNGEELKFIVAIFLFKTSRAVINADR